MATRATPGPRLYEDFLPSSEWTEDEKSDILLVNLPGFKKEQIKVQIDNYGNLRISGERPLGGLRWRRFRSDHRMPENYNVAEIRAKFENERLHVTLPKLITQAEVWDEPMQQAHKPPASRNSTPEPKPSLDHSGTSQKASSETFAWPDNVAAAGIKENDKMTPTEGPIEAAGTIKDRIDDSGTSQKASSETFARPDNIAAARIKENEKMTPTEGPIKAAGTTKDLIDDSGTSLLASSKTFSWPDNVAAAGITENEKMTPTEGPIKAAGTTKDGIDKLKETPMLMEGSREQESENGGQVVDAEKRKPAADSRASGPEKTESKVGDQLAWLNGKRREVMVNVAVSALVLVGLAVYAVYNLR